MHSLAAEPTMQSMHASESSFSLSLSLLLSLSLSFSLYIYTASNYLLFTLTHIPAGYWMWPPNDVIFVDYSLIHHNYVIFREDAGNYVPNIW